MSELVLIVTLAGRRIALPASEVEGVVELEGLTPAPRAAPHVAGLSALRSRVLTVIDGVAALALGNAETTTQANAIAIPSGGHTYALLVDSVEDVVTPCGPAEPVPSQPGAGWDRVAVGMIDVGDDLLLLIDPHRLIAGPLAQAA